MRFPVAAVIVVAAVVALSGQSAPRPGTPVGPGTAAGGAGQPRPGAPRTPPRAPNPAAADPSRGTAVIRGQVVAADSGAPIRRAQVRLSAEGVRDSRLATSDAQGRFEIRDLLPARYTLTASKGGFVTLQYGQRRPGESGTPLELGDGQVLDRIGIALPRGSVISGRVSDEFGEPIANAAVLAWRYTFVAGVRRPVRAGARDTTDDQGQYRLFGLAPGDYIVSAALRTAEITDPGDELAGFAPTYYPGTPSAAEAQRVRLTVSQDQGGISFALTATRLVRVSGQVLSASGAPHWSGSVTLASASAPAGADGPRGMQGNGARIEGDGSFWLSNISPGRYQLGVRAGDREHGEFARLDLVVGNEDLAGVTVVTAPAGRIHGVVVTDSGVPLPGDGPGVQVFARPASPDLQSGPRGGSQARAGADGAFELGNITDPRVIRVSAPSGWTLRSVALGTQEVTDLPLEVSSGQVLGGLRVTITQKTGLLEGGVFDDARRPVLDATVVVFPLDETLRGYQSRFVHSARPDQDGRFRVVALPPAEYLAVAVQGLEDGQANDPDFLRSIESMARRLRIDEGETETVALELRGSGR